MSTENQLCQTDSIIFDLERALHFKTKGRFCDLVIHSTANDNKEIINCHKVILASVSPYFEDKLGKGRINNLSIPTVEHETLEILIDYMYGGGELITVLNAENVFKICAGANLLKLNRLVIPCLQFIKSLITFEDVIQIFKFSLTEDFPTLAKTCIDFIVKNLGEVKTLGFLDLDCEQIKMLVEHAIVIQSLAMADILRAVSEWLHSNLEERQQYAFGLINKIPLSKIRLTDLRTFIREDDCFKNIPEIYSLYVDAVEEIGLQSEQIEKRKAEELATYCNEEGAVKALSEPGSSKRGRFSNEAECTSEMTNFPTDESNIVIDISLAQNVTESTLTTSIRGEKKAVVYFVTKEVVPGICKYSIASYDLESKDIGILGRHLEFDRRDTCLVYHSHRIYSLGNSIITKGVVCNPVAVFNVLTNLWEEHAPDLLEDRGGFKTVELGGYLYTVGGPRCWESRDMERLKIQKPYGKWEKLAKAPHGSGDFGIGVANGCIYVIGGNMRNLYGNFTLRKDVICYDPKHDEWVNKKNMPIPKRGFAVAVFDRHIYVLGGSHYAFYKIGKGLSSVHIYDTELDIWKEGISMNKNRLFFSAIVYNNYIYALGGDSQDGPTMERFSVERQVWEDMGLLPESGLYHTIAPGFAK